MKQAVYLFPDEISMTNALGNWLGECFEDFDNLAVLQVDLTGAELHSEVDWEIQCMSKIGAKKFVLFVTSKTSLIIVLTE